MASNPTDGENNMLPSSMRTYDDGNGNDGTGTEHHDGVMDHHQGTITVTMSSSSYTNCADLDDVENNDDAVALLNDVCKIRALAMQGVPAVTSKAELQSQELSSRPGSFAVPGNRPASTSALPHNEDGNYVQDSDDDDNSVRAAGSNGISVVETTTTLSNSLCEAQCITAATLATEREMIYQEVMESVAANAVIADIVGFGNDDDDDTTNNKDNKRPSFSSHSCPGDDETGQNSSELQHKYNQLRRRRRMCISFIVIKTIMTLVVIGVLIVIVRRRRNSAN